MIKEPLEKDIQAGICDYLALRRHFFWRQNTQPIFSRKDFAYRAMPKHTMNGVADIILIRPGGRVVFLEVKRPSGKQSDSQVAFQARCRLAEAEYYVVTSLGDVQRLGF